MWLCISLLSLYVVTILAKYRMKASLFQVIPFIYSCLLLVLYGMSFFNILSKIDIILLVLLILAVYVIARFHLWHDIRSLVIDDVKTPRLWIWIISTMIGVLLIKDKAFYYWDDFVFWAVDAKAIFFNDGLGYKGVICAANNGTYPPIPQLTEWFMLHLRGKFSQGWIYAGLFVSLQIYLAPLVDIIPKKWNIGMILGIPFLIGFGSFSMNKMASLSPDFLVAILFGCLLCVPFYKIEWKYKVLVAAVEMAVLSIVKNVSFQWVGLVLVFYFLYYGKILFNRMTAIALPISSIPFIVWQLYCRWAGRTTAGGYYSTSNIISNAVVKTQSKVDRLELLRSFCTASLKGMQQPDQFVGVSVSWLISVVAFGGIILLYFKKYDASRYLSIKRFIEFAILSEVVVLLFFVEVLFINEYYIYEDVDNMLLIFSRYGCPLSIGLFYMVAYLWGIRINCATDESIKAQLIVSYSLIGVSIVLSPWNVLLDNFYDYRNDSEKTSVNENDQYWLSDSLYESMLPIENVLATIRQHEELDNEKIVVASSDYELIYLQYVFAPCAMTRTNIDFSQSIEMEKYLKELKANDYQYFLYIDLDDAVNITTDNYEIESNEIYYIDDELNLVKI